MAMRSVHPDMIEVAARGDQVIRLRLCDWPGLTMAGPGAPAALRAWLATVFTRNGPYGVEILAVGSLGDLLFPGLQLPELRRMENLEATLSLVEGEMASRTSSREGRRRPMQRPTASSLPSIPFRSYYRHGSHSGVNRGALAGDGGLGDQARCRRPAAGSRRQRRRGVGRGGTRPDSRRGRWSSQRSDASIAP